MFTLTKRAAQRLKISHAGIISEASINRAKLCSNEHRADFGGVARIRVDCRALTLQETAQIVQAYKAGGAEIENFTRGHYFRGVD